MFYFRLSILTRLIVLTSGIDSTYWSTKNMKAHRAQCQWGSPGPQGHNFLLNNIKASHFDIRIHR